MTVADKKTRIGETLVQQGILTPDDLGRALAQQKATGVMLGEILVEQGIIQASQLIQALAASLEVQGCILRHGLTLQRI